MEALCNDNLVRIALEWFAKHKGKKRHTKNVLLNARVIPKPGGNKVWQIDLSFFRTSFRLGRVVIGTTFRAQLACHIHKDFTAYSVCFGDREYWFDQFELALQSLQPQEISLRKKVSFC